jgi:putative restriction endonuclease
VFFGFRLVKNPSTGFNYEPNLSLPDPDSESSGGSGSAPGDRQPPRIPDIVWRIVRTQAGEWVKKLYKFECQVCGECLETRAGRYAHGAHIQPLGRPFNGPDIKENILCLCPNHHALFDNGGFGIAEDFGLIGLRGSLRSDPSHELNPAYFEWHRTNILPMATG